MKKIYYLFSLLIVLSFNNINAQTCPASLGQQSNTTTAHFKITSGDCVNFPPGSSITIDGISFIRTTCNGTNLKYASEFDISLPDPLNFTVDFGFSTCTYVNGELVVLSDKDSSLDKMLSIYPNPFMSGENITLKVANNISAKLYLYNVTGKLVLSDAINNFNRVELNASNLTNGMYFLQVETDDASATRKIIIMK